MDALQESAIQLIKPLSKDTGELVRLDLSVCGLTSDYIVRLNDEASLITSILELNLGGNPIMKEVRFFLLVYQSLLIHIKLLK